MQKIELERIIDQIERLYSNNWTGIDIQQMLNDIDDAMANNKLPIFANTIHQIAQHLTADSALVIKRLQGFNYTPSKEEDWTPHDQLNQIPWSHTKSVLLQSKDDLIEVLQGLSDNNLDNPILENHYSVYVTLHGHIQHAYYHFGQISQMKKAIKNLNLQKFKTIL